MSFKKIFEKMHFDYQKHEFNFGQKMLIIIFSYIKFL